MKTFLEIVVGLVIGGILLFGSCALLFTIESPDSIELVAQGSLDGYVPGMVIANTIIQATIDGESYDLFEICNANPQLLKIGDEYWLYNLYREGCNSRWVISNHEINMARDYAGLKVTEGKRGSIFKVDK